jgi:hypothetical protein
MRGIRRQARLLVERIVHEYKRQVMSEERPIIRGTVAVTINDQIAEYDYEAEVDLNVQHYSQKHPYGMGTASEEMSEVNIENIEVRKIMPCDGAPNSDQNYEAIHQAIVQDVSEKVQNL